MLGHEIVPFLILAQYWKVARIDINRCGQLNFPLTYLPARFPLSFYKGLKELALKQATKIVKSPYTQPLKTDDLGI